MDFKSLLAGVIAVAVAVIVFTSLLMPVVSTSTAEYNVMKNTGTYFKAVGGTDEHAIVISTGDGSFVITTDGKTDITPTMGTYNPGGQYVAPAVAIGVYEANPTVNNTLTSESGITVTPVSANNFRQYALNNNTDVTTGTYQLVNWYHYNLYGEMASAIMGTLDSNGFMGNGNTSGTALATGTTSSSYVKSEDNSAVTLLIENPWGNRWNILGDSRVTTSAALRLGNVLGTKPYNSSQGEYVGYTFPSYTDDNNFVTSICIDEAWKIGLPNTLGADTDAISTGTKWVQSTSGFTLMIGGRTNNNTGLYDLQSPYVAYHQGSSNYGSRLAYVMTNYEPITPSDYGIVIEYNATGSEIVSVSALVDGELTTDGMTTGTTIGDYWQFDENGIGPFGCYYVAINLSDVDTTSNVDYLAESMIGTKKGQVAYVLDPTDFTKTLGGTSYTSGNYNVMLVIPTVYTGVSDGKLYMSNSPETFSDVDGLEMKPYAHTYTVDPSVDTGNPTSTASATLVYGEDWIVRLYATGDVYLITTNNMINLGQVSGENTVEFSITGDELTYTPVGGSATTVDDALAYIADKGEYVQTKLPYFSVHDGINFIIGGYANNLSAEEGDVVDIGYCYRVTAEGGASDVSHMSVTTTLTATLDPVSDAGYSVDSTTQVWVEESNKADWPGANVMRNVSSDLWQIGDLKVTTTWTDGNDAYDESTATYNYYLAPATVHYKNTDYVEGPTGTILAIIPVMIVLGLLLGAVGAFLYTRSK